jgi:hypothetical protein
MAALLKMMLREQAVVLAIHKRKEVSKEARLDNLNAIIQGIAITF